jgi:hypothetical protein
MRRAAVRQTCFDTWPFATDVVEGLEALPKREVQDRIEFRQKTGTGEIHSVDIDGAMRADYPTSERWDYGICYGRTVKKVVFIELHKAESGEVRKLINKQRWLKGLLTGYPLPEHRWYWLPTGKISILPNSTYARQLTAARILLVRKDPLLLD